MRLRVFASVLCYNICFVLASSKRFLYYQRRIVSNSFKPLRFKILHAVIRDFKKWLIVYPSSRRYQVFLLYGQPISFLICLLKRIASKVPFPADWDWKNFVTLNSVGKPNLVWTIIWEWQKLGIRPWELRKRQLIWSGRSWRWRAIQMLIVCWFEWVFTLLPRINPTFVGILAHTLTMSRLSCLCL